MIRIGGGNDGPEGHEWAWIAAYAAMTGRGARMTGGLGAMNRAATENLPLSAGPLFIAKR